jgi:AmmeMemoRadiSam system protein A
MAARPEALILISPHSPLDWRRFTARGAPVLRGDFADFLAAGVKLTFKNDPDLLEAIKDAAPQEGVEFLKLDRDYPLDHGALVPLYYLREAGWDGPTVVIGFTMQPIDKHLAFGRAIRRAVENSGRRVALVASGDLSHRLIPGGPYEYEPTAHLFDEQIVEAVARGDARAIIEIDPDLRERAGECGYRSIVIALGSLKENMPDHQVLSYEGPFGVGYMVAVLLEESSSARVSRAPLRAEFAFKKPAAAPGPAGDISPPELARLAVEKFVTEEAHMPAPEEPQGVLAERAGVFVTIRARDGKLRGCIGTIGPTQENVAQEIIQNAISAATRDPRFPPVSPEELADLTYGVDVLSEPEEVGGMGDLDPSRYGVIVETLDGRHRGLLLPRIEGIDTAEQQWQLVHAKAGIKPGTPVRIKRFTVRRFGKE